jgi:hypothetical protein
LLQHLTGANLPVRLEKHKKDFAAKSAKKILRIARTGQVIVKRLGYFYAGTDVG